MATLTVYANAGDSRPYRESGTWSSQQSGTTDEADTTAEAILQVISYSNPVIIRTSTPFDISAVTGTVTAADFVITATGTQDLGTTDEFVLQTHTRTSHTGYTNTDYNKTNFGSEIAARVARASWNGGNDETNTVALNATGVTYLNDGLAGDGWADMGLRMGDDVDNDGPANNGVIHHSTENTESTAYDPYLFITYTPTPAFIPKIMMF